MSARNRGLALLACVILTSSQTTLGLDVTLNYVSPLDNPDSVVVPFDPSVPGVGPEDAAAFAIALTNPELYVNTYGIEADEAGDIDDDFDIDFDDIDDFVALIPGMSMAEMMEIIRAAQRVPEPAGLTQCLVSCCLLFRTKRGRRSHS